MNIKISYPAFISQAIGRASLLHSNLPTSSQKIYHVINNIAQKSDTRLLHIGENLSYSLYKNDHVLAHWIDDVEVSYNIENLIPRPDVAPYNFIYVPGDRLRTGMLYHLHDKLSTDIVFVVVDTRVTLDSKNLVDRCINNVSNLRVDFKVEINDKNNANGWDNGITIYHLKNIDALNPWTK